MGRARNTGASRISVVIPALNEEACIGATIASVCAADPWEVIVVDGGSTDRTCGIADALGARILEARPGRARQMNAGAGAATGEILLFLHSDTLLPARYDRLVRRVLSRPGTIAGAFRLRIESTRASLRAVEWLANWRSRVLQMPYGDQALFLRRGTFEAVAGFAAVSVMEDFDLLRRLRRMGRVGISPAAVVTSARRWLHAGVLCTTLLNQLCIAAHLAGVSSEVIASWRARPNAPAQVRGSGECRESFLATGTFPGCPANRQRM